MQRELKVVHLVDMNDPLCDPEVIVVETGVAEARLILEDLRAGGWSPTLYRATLEKLSHG
jgi:hypothetical protein